MNFKELNEKLETATPETYAEYNRIAESVAFDDQLKAMADFARRLERERDQARRDKDIIQEWQLEAVHEADALKAKFAAVTALLEKRTGALDSLTAWADTMIVAHQHPFLNNNAISEARAALQTATAQHEGDRDRHLRRLYSWACQDPTGPWEKDEIKSWVLNELCGAMGKSTRPLEWEPESLRANQKVPTAQHAPTTPAEGQMRVVGADIYGQQHSALIATDQHAPTQGEGKPFEERVQDTYKLFGFPPPAPTTQGGDWAQMNEIRDVLRRYANDQTVTPRQALTELSDIAFRLPVAPQPDLASVREAVKSAIHYGVLPNTEEKMNDLVDAIMSALTPLLGANEDGERLDWLEAAWDRGELPGDFCTSKLVKLSTVRAAIDAARHSAPKEGGAQ